MEHQPKFAEKRMSYELERDKDVEELAEKLLYLKEATEQVFPSFVIRSSLYIGKNLLYNVSAIRL
jgi:hypothetical protein